MRTGIVVSWERGWGFIKADDDNKEYFCHWSSLKMEGFKTVEVGDVVEFEIGPGNRTGVQAVNVTLIGRSYE